MISTRSAAHCVHQTTMWILQHLKCYSWDAKALIAIAALSLEYGSFVHLTQFQTNDVLGNSLRQLNQVQRRNASAVGELVTYIVQVFQHINVCCWWLWSRGRAWLDRSLPSHPCCCIMVNCCHRCFHRQPHWFMVSYLFRPHVSLMKNNLNEPGMIIIGDKMKQLHIL